MKTFFGYIRVSTLKQGEQGVSLQEQRDAIINYSQRHGLKIEDWFEERETAAKYGRPIFSQMLRALKRGKVTGVIIHKIDRSARNLKDWADLGELIDAGVEVHFANENLDLHTRGGRLSADIQAVVAADYIRNLREETRKGFYGRLKQGIYPLPAPLGYIDKGKGNPKEIDPVKGPLLKKTFELYSTGKYNLDSLADEMSRLGLRSRTDGKISKNALSFILNNPFYIGLIRLKGTGETFDGAHEPLIPKSLFDRVHDILSGKTNAKSAQYDFIFRKMLKCGQCGYSLIGEVQKGFVYYRCHTKYCPTTCVREDSIEKTILPVLSDVQFSDESNNYLLSKLAALRQNWTDERKMQIETIKLSICKLQDRLNRITDGYIDGILEKELFEERKAALLSEKKALEEKLCELCNEERSVPDQVAEFLELAKGLYLSYIMALAPEKGELLKTVTSNRLVDGKNVVIELNFPFNEVAKCTKMINSGPYRDRPRTEPLDRLFEVICEYFKTAPANILKSFKKISYAHNMNDHSLSGENNFAA